MDREPSQLIVDVERSSDGNIDGLELDGSVEVTVGAIDEPSPIKAKQQQERGLESNGIFKVENRSSIVNRNWVITLSYYDRT